ncbi:MAG: DeoR/GlpR family DNA-binding transcription regulator [Spirochaetota bacterium]
MAIGLIPADRQQRIKELIAEQGVVRVNELSDLFDVSVLTVRRDLDVLEQQGYLERSHGGAVRRQNLQIEPLFIQKERQYTREKEAIGLAAASMISEGDMVLINSGSTTLQVIKALKDKRVTIITNNVAAAAVADEAAFDIIFLGGNYRSQSHSSAGNFALMALERVYANKVVIGVDGFSFTHGLTTPNMNEAEVTRSMMEKTVGSIIVAAASNKMGVVSNFKTSSVEKIDYLVTDRAAEDFLTETELQRAGIRLIVAD